MALQIEVAQVEAQCWKPSTVADWRGIYLEVYLEKKAKRRKLRCCCRRKKRNKQKMSKTAVEDEARNMRWRKVNNEGFLQALFYLEYDGKRRRKGDQLVIVADVMVVTEMGQARGEKVATYKGMMQLGTWGPVVLYDVDGESQDAGGEDEEVASFTLETRPISARPFKLENAKPWDDRGSLAMIMRAARFGRRNSVQNLRPRVSPNPKYSKKKDDEDRTVSKKSRKSNWSVGSLLRKGHEDLHPSLEPEEEGSEEPHGMGLAASSGADSQWTIDLKPMMRLRAEDRNVPGEVGVTRDKSSEDVDDAAAEGTVSRNSLQLRSVLDKWLESTDSDTLQEPAKRQQRHWLLRGGGHNTSSSFTVLPLEECNREWKPSDWQTMWHSSTKGSKEHPASKSDGQDVVPLMEAEFRRDCVVFFNTLFPNVDAGNFQLLREMSLSEESSQPVRFRKAVQVPERRSEHPGSDPGWMMRVMSRVSARPMGRMLQWQSVASSRGDRRLREEDDLELGEVPSPRPPKEGSGAASATSSTNSQMLGAAPSDSDVMSSTGLNGDQDLLFCLKLDMLDNMDEARSVVIPPRAPETGRSRRGPEEDFSDIAEEKQVVLVGQQARQKRQEELRDSSYSMPMDADDDDVVAEERRESPQRARIPRRISDRSVNSVAESYAIARSNLTPLIARLSNGTVVSSMEHGVIPEHIIEQGAELFIDDYSPRIMFLKRLLVCYALCGVYYSEAGNAEQLGDPWPYPIAAILGHGSRVLIRLEDVEPSEFLNYLLTGDPNVLDWKDSRPPMPIQKRIAATHSVELKETGQIVERKLRVTNVTDAVGCLRGNHMGLNLPIGGAGNQSPLGSNYLVDFRGHVLKRTMGVSSVPSLLSRIPLPWRKSDETGTSPARSGGALTSEGSEISGSSKVSREDWKLERRVQSGHLYIRTDDFGAVTCSRSSIGVTEGDAKSRFQSDKDSAHVRMAKARQQAELRSDLQAGDLLFPKSVPQLNTRNSCSATRSALGHLPLLRVQSEPEIGGSVNEGASTEDIVWFGQALVARQNQPLTTPPSAAALKMLIEHYDPVNANLYGTGSFKSIEAFRKELASGSSLLARSHKGGLRRFCQPVILQLRFRGCVLMKMGESRENSDELLSKPTFAVLSAGLTEHWRSAVMRILSSELCIKTGLIEALTPTAKREQDCLTVLTETTMSPSYPGMPSVYRTHMVSWEVEPDRGDALLANGLIFPDDGSSPTSSSPASGLPFNCHFVTNRNGTGKRIFWRWVPFFEAQKLQRFVNLGEATADERWAKYAFQKEGVVQFPPTETALMILLRRCGVDVDQFGTDRYRTLKEFWLDLTAKESLLQMSGGKPLRLADSTVVRLRWRPPGERGYQVLVKEQKNSKGKRKLLTRRMLNGETWEESALNCIEEDLVMKPRQGKLLLAQKSFDAKSYTFFQELTESDRYPGIKCLYRCHLVSYVIKEELGVLLSNRRDGMTSEPTLLQGLLPSTLLSPGPGTSPDLASPAYEAVRTSVQSTPMTDKSSTDRMDRTLTNAVTGAGTERNKQRLSLKPLPNMVWVPENMLHGVKGGDLWAQAEKHQEVHRVCSVMLGLEGSEPQTRSPWGQEHDGTGTSAPISALGNCKWKTYRLNNALQVPADHGGLRMNITKQMFEELRRTCKKLDLLHPSLDLTLEPKCSRPRELLEQRYAEKEVFKRILSSNAADAKAIVEWMVDHRSVNKTFRAKVQAVVGTQKPGPEVYRRVRASSEFVEYSS